MNRLANSRSPYLRHAAQQPIDWYPWGEEALERARRENKPIFLSSGAVWCHWCHVMARESFEDEEVARILNASFISIKVDRDERPEIDRRYQRAAAALGVPGGWPLTVFLGDDGVPFFAGTYFPPRDSEGRPGFKTVLRKIADLYRSRRGEVDEYAATIGKALRSSQPGTGQISPFLLDGGARAAKAAFDEVNGGFGSAPKFPMTGMLGFLLQRCSLSPDDEIERVVRKTLVSMARGGYYDQLAGGFHRYSVDSGWLVPHFEKMADDNAWLLRTYAAAFLLLKEPFFGDVVRGMAGFLEDELFDRAEGGFFASQDADVAGDEGGYFTWTRRELEELLEPEELEVLSLRFLTDEGKLHHDPEKMVLSLVHGPEEIGRRLGMETQRVQRILESGRGKLLAARSRRQKPFTDTTLYTSLNGLVSTAFFHASRALANATWREMAARSLARVLADHASGRELLHTAGVEGLLEDYAFLTEALAEAYEVTAERAYLDRAASLMDAALDRFWDSRRGGFFDSTSDLLGMKLQDIEDMPHPSANAVAISVLVRLGLITGKDDYLGRARTALDAFAPAIPGLGIHAGSYLASLDTYLNRLKFTVAGGPGTPLASALLSRLNPVAAIWYDEAGAGGVVPCFRETCYAPIGDPEEVKRFLEARSLLK